MTLNSPLIEYDDGLTEMYVTLGKAIVQQARTDYLSAREAEIALETPPEERTKKLARRVQTTLGRNGWTEEFALTMMRRQMKEVIKFFSSPVYEMYTDIAPEIILKGAEEEAQRWAKGLVKTGKKRIAMDIVRSDDSRYGEANDSRS